MNSFRGLAFLLAVVLLAACGESPPPSPAGAAVDVAANTGPTGEELYLAHCQQCHEGKVAKAPPVSLLGIMSASSVFNAIETGVMRTQAQEMDSAGRRRLAEYLTNQKIGGWNRLPH